MALYLEQYFDGLQKLPAELNANMSKLRTMDEEACHKLQQADKLVRVYMRAGKSIPKEKKAAKFACIKQLMTEAHMLSDEKVTLAASTYEMVDKYIRKLDADLIRFEGDIKRRLCDSKGTEEEATPKPGQKAVSRSHKRAAAPSTTTHKKSKTEEVPTKTFGMSLESSHIANLSGTALLQKLAGGETGASGEMRIDPNEPTYCVCKQVSFGEMVACDNEDCPVEWFHFLCVGLTAKPKGKWFCNSCVEQRKKKQH